MNKQLRLNLAILCLTFLAFTSCQKDEENTPDPSWVIDFNQQHLEPESFWNGSDGSGGFEAGPMFFPNDYNQDWASWSGFALSNITDNTTPGWDNQYSAFPGKGFSGNPNYTIMYVSEYDPTNALRFTEAHKGKTIRAIYVTNTTYAALSMRDGDPFSKKFGGETGNDPDWFRITIKGVRDGQIIDNKSIEFYLADYRFTDNSKNYIIQEWTRIELGELGEVDEIRFFLDSSDMGEWGMNTPSYFALGRVEID